MAMFFIVPAIATETATEKIAVKGSYRCAQMYLRTVLKRHHGGQSSPGAGHHWVVDSELK